jgi:EAL domain-containing protein (putative c-di-GMP-specific phosphodiesterase class I)
MSIERSVLEKLLRLPVDKQKKVLEFVESLENKSAAGRPRRSLKGLWADLGVAVSAEDLAEARREMWGGFPREDL